MLNFSCLFPPVLGFVDQMCQASYMLPLRWQCYILQCCWRGSGNITTYREYFRRKSDYYSLVCIQSRWGGWEDRFQLNEAVESIAYSLGWIYANTEARHKFHKRVAPNADDIVPLMGKYISNPSQGIDIKVRQEAMRCFQVRYLWSPSRDLMRSWIQSPTLEDISVHANWVIRS